MNNCLVIKELNGFFDCKSGFGRHYLTCDNFSAEFLSGITVLYCDIDYSGWAVSYLLSDMPIKGQFFEPFEIALNGKNIRLEELKKHSVYVDKMNEHLNKKITVRKQVEKNIKKNKLNLTSEDIRKLFEIDSERYDREYTCVGNEIWRCLSAIAYTDMKSVFCFPWISERMVSYYGLNLKFCCEVLSSLNKIVILPTNFKFSESCGINIIDIKAEREKTKGTVSK